MVISPRGSGTVSGVTNGQWLEINQAYSATAKSNGTAGFVFTSWVQATNGADWATSNVPALNFIMRSNLVLVANFADVRKPTNTVASPTPNQRWSNAVFTVKGTARDNCRVTGVWCQTNGVWGPVLTGNGWTNWTMDVALVPGTNTVRAYAVDGAGNRSVTNSVNFVYVVSGRLVVQATGPCTLSPSYSNTMLEIGRSFSMTVTPGKGYVFSNWVGTVFGKLVIVSNTPKLTFTMQSNLVLQANIIPSPFIPVKGNYEGLFAEPQAHRAQESSGFLSLTLSDSGAYSGSLKRGTGSYPFTGQFDLAGRANKAVSRPGTNAWVVAMWVDFAAQQLLRWVSNSVSGGWASPLLADRAAFDTRTNPAAQYAGQYTLRIPGGTNEDGTLALGDGYLTLSVALGGQMTFRGSLADGTTVGLASTAVCRMGFVPLYVPLYSGKGSVWSWLSFDTNLPSLGLDGWLSWIKPAGAGTYDPAGLPPRSE